MGAIGHRIFDDDAARDLRDAFRHMVRMPVDGAALAAYAAKYAAVGDDPSDSGYTTFWLALADLFHAYAIDAPAVFKRAHTIISSGADAAAMRDLGMSEKDLARRAVHLKELAEKWAVPSAKPRSRRIMRKQERHAVAPGDVFAYPVAGPNPIAHGRYGEKPVVPDGWNAFVVCGVDHRFGLFSRAFVAMLYAFSPRVQDLARCRRSPIAGMTYSENDPPRYTMANWTIVNREALERMGAVAIGSCRLDPCKVRSRLPGTDRVDRCQEIEVYAQLGNFDDPLRDDSGMFLKPLDFLLQDLE